MGSPSALHPTFSSVISSATEDQFQHFEIETHKEEASTDQNLNSRVGISVDVQTILQDTEIKIAFTLKSTVPSLHANEATYVIRVQYSISS